LVAHPNEIIVIWLSKHGSPCATGNDQYPDVPAKVKLDFWNNILSLFSTLVVNVKKTPINSTSINDLLSLNTRVIFYATDYVQFTGNSDYALDGCLVDNQLCDSIGSGMSMINCSLSNFQNAAEILKSDAKSSKFFLHSMASSEPGDTLLYMFLITYADLDDKDFRKKCSAPFKGIPNLSDQWCPPHLLDISQLQNYYNQFIFEYVVKKGYRFPNAIYLDALDIDGTIRAGNQIYKKRDGDHEVVRYAYAYTLILSNLVGLCGPSPSPQCAQLISQLQGLRANYPIQKWDDPSNGRSSTWPFTV